MHFPQKGIKAIYKQRKLPIAALQKKHCPWQTKEIHEIWLAVLTVYHTRKPKDWSCAVGQRWVILYWNVKCQLTVQSWCCFKMHENCMEQKKQRVVGKGFRICMQDSKYVVSVHTHRPGTLQDWSRSRAFNAILTQWGGPVHEKHPWLFRLYGGDVWRVERDSHVLYNSNHLSTAAFMATKHLNKSHSYRCYPPLVQVIFWVLKKWAENRNITSSFMCSLS